MSERAKSYDKSTVDSNGINLLYCRGAKIYRDPQLLAKRKVIINTSTSKQMYKFGGEKRFMNYAKPWDAFFYDLPSVKDKFTTSLGRGKKYDFYKNIMRGKTHNYYDIPREFDLKRRNTPQYSFGKGRDVCKKPEFNVVKPTPGVGTYNIGKNLGDDALKFSIFGREWVNRKISPSNSLITPGPGHYEETLKTNPSGNYISSLYGNTCNIYFSGPQRFKYDINKTPGPGNYETSTMFNKTGLHYTSKFHSMMAKTMSDRPKNFYEPYKVSTTPGPGSYDIFSDFTGYSDIHKKCKCGRRLGHPPVTEGDNTCERNPKMMTVSVNKNRKNLNINLTDSNKTNENKKSNNIDDKYKTIT